MRTNGEFNALHRLVGQDAYLIDVGSNVRDWADESTRVATGEQSRFLAIDANSKFLETLRRSFQGDRRISVRHCAVSGFIGKANFWRNANDVFSGSNSLYHHHYLAGANTTVDVVTLGVTLSQLGWPRDW